MEAFYLFVDVPTAYSIGQQQTTQNCRGIVQGVYPSYYYMYDTYLVQQCKVRRVIPSTEYQVVSSRTAACSHYEQIDG